MSVFNPDFKIGRSILIIRSDHLTFPSPCGPLPCKLQFSIRGYCGRGKSIAFVMFSTNI